MTASMDIGCFDREVQVQFRDVFGRPLCYPMNTTAKRLCSLTGNLTLSPSDLKVIVDGTVGVNGRTVPHTEWCSLENGDKIECGRWIFHFEQEA